MRQACQFPGGGDAAPMIRHLPALAAIAALAAGLLGTAARAQVVINLDSVIGVAGTDAGSVAGVGNRVNLTGVASDSGVTNLIAVGSTGSSSFNFNTGFSDSLDRVIGSTASAGLVIADMKHDSGASGLLILDTNNDGVFSEGVVSGFGLHGDTFVTFDLAAIRANAGMAVGTPLTLTGQAGQANWTVYTSTSAAIIVDGNQRAVFDWTASGPTSEYSTFSLTLTGTSRYLTFIGLSGLDLDNYGAHVGFANVQLQGVPEPSTVVLLGSGLAGVAVAALRRRSVKRIVPPLSLAD